MKVKWTNVSDARGKLAGMVASKNRSGNFLRAKVTPLNRQTSAQLRVRSLLAFFSAAWASLLSQAQRLAWDSMAHSYPKTNVFGDAYTPTGKNLFTALNINRRLVSQTTNLLTPLLPVSIPSPSLEVTNTTLAAWVVAGVGLDGDFRYVVRATPPLSAGVGFFKGKFKLIGDIDGTDPVSVVLSPASYAAIFGAPLQGQRIAVQIVGIDPLSGSTSLAGEISFIVT